MSKRTGRRKQRALSARDLLGHWMMGSLLGIVCAGFLLIDRNPALGCPHACVSSLDRLVFLVTMGTAFGLGAALTGAMFKVYGDGSDTRV